jgi:hypothetical protein
MSGPPAASPAAPTKFVDGVAALEALRAARPALHRRCLGLVQVIYDAQPNPRLNARGTRSLAPVPEPPAEGGGGLACHVPLVREHPVMAGARPHPVQPFPPW